MPSVVGLHSLSLESTLRLNPVPVRDGTDDYRESDPFNCYLRAAGRVVSGKLAASKSASADRFVRMQIAQRSHVALRRPTKPFLPASFC